VWPASRAKAAFDAAIDPERSTTHSGSASPSSSREKNECPLSFKASPGRMRACAALASRVPRHAAIIASAARPQPAPPA
jgi:hypothetical protein